MVDEDEKRMRVRRGSEHVRIKGTTEELGEIVPPPVTAVPSREAEEPPEGAETIEIDDGEEVYHSRHR
jgi:hypothetical protein